MNKYIRHIVFILFLFLDCKFSFAQVYDNELAIINKVRAEHFEQGKPLDTLTLSKFYTFSDNSVKNISLLIKATYALERYNLHADKRVVDLISDKSWIENPILDNLKDLVIDDLFRVCIVSKRYMLFHSINLYLFYDSPYNLFSLSYVTYIYLKTGNIYKFLDSQLKLKNAFVAKSDSLHKKVSSKVFDRLKMNVTSIGLYNFDTLNNFNFKNSLIKYAVFNIDSSSNYENLLFTIELSNYGLSKNFNNYIDILRETLKKKYCPPFILYNSYNNIDWIDSRKYFYELLYVNKYPTNVGLLLSVDLFIIDYEKFKRSESDNTFSLGVNNSNIGILQDVKSIIPEMNFVDSLLRRNFFFEPDWIQLKTYYVFKQNILKNTIQDILSDIEKKGNIDYTKNTLKNMIYSLRLKKSMDFSNLIDVTNQYYAPYTLLDYYGKLKNNSHESAYNLFKVCDSLLQIIRFTKKTNFFKGYLTNEKHQLMIGLLNSIEVMKKIFISQKMYDYYEEVQKSLDVSEYLDDSIPEELYIIKDKYRYLNFMKSAPDFEKDKFDSLFIRQIQKYIDTPSLNDSTQLQNRFYFNTGTAKNILIDIYYRNKISDSLLVNYLSFLEAQNQVANRLSNDLLVYHQSEDSLQAISSYKNPYFCIDNTKFKFNRSNDDLFYKAKSEYDKYKHDKSLVDSESKYLFYFIAENYNLNDYKGISNFDSLKYFVYLAYGDQFHDNFRRLISIDSLNKIFDLNIPKSSQFFSPSYFRQLNQKSYELYEVLLKPIENFIDTNFSYKIVMPSNLVTLPLDYLYAKKKGVLPNFIEYSDITGLMFKRESSLNLSDTITVFGGMNYEDIYCNINKAYDPNIRSGLTDLAYSKIEMAEINKSIKVKNYISNEATKYNFIKSLLDTNTSNIHLITHGAYIPLDNFDNIDNNKSSYNVPQLADERQLLFFSSDSTKDKFRNNILTSSEIKYLDNLSHIKLVYLSACETGLIDDYGSNKSGSIGFSRELLDRGAQSVIATRWKVQDKAASEFASDFYRNLSLFKQYDKAFYQTKLKYFKENRPPFIWTSYIFVK